MRYRISILFSGWLALCAAPPTIARHAIERLDAFNQTQFQQFSADLGAALHYKSLAPSEPLGLLGFDIGAEASVTQLRYPELFALADEPALAAEDYLLLGRLHAHKGLPFGWDLGLSYSQAAGSNIRVLGGELRYTFIDENLLLPALSVRASYARLFGVEVMDLQSYGLELGVSKGFLLARPYAGVGRIWTHSEANNAHLDAERLGQWKAFAGLNFNFLGLNAAAEADQTDGVNSLHVKLSIRF